FPLSEAEPRPRARASEKRKAQSRGIARVLRHDQFSAFGGLRLRLIRPTSLRGGYFQPDSLSQALRSSGWVFSHWVMDLVSLSSIFSFMHMQYLRMTPSAAPPLLSAMHWLIHFTSSLLS